VGQQPVELILLRQWASYLTLPIFVLGADGNVVYYNEPAETLLGRTFDEFGEAPFHEYTDMFEITDEHGVPIRPEEFVLAIAMQEHRPAHDRYRYRALDGCLHTIDVTAIPIEGHDEQHLGALAIFWEAHST